MKKFRAEHARTIAASLSDPVAVRCIQKMVHSSDEDEENVQEDTLELCGERREEQALPSEGNDALTELKNATINSSLSSSNALMNTIEPITVASQLQIESSYSLKSEMSGQLSSVVSSDVVPIYTLPLFSYGLQGNFISTATTTTTCASTSVEGKRYITLTTANMANNPATTIVIAPPFNTLG